jgi:hypothetical protein
MKNWTIERFMAKQRNTEALDDPEYYLYKLSNLCAISEESDGQFTGGYYTVTYIYDGMVYEFDWWEDMLQEGRMFPVEFL